MEITLIESVVYAHPKHPVEFLVAVDGKVTRVAIEWALIARLIGDAPVDADRVREFLHRNRGAVTLALRAHMFAQGVPLNRYLVMSPDDFDLVASVARPAFGTRTRDSHTAPLQ